jgi:heme-degrading monooxygenase HmoA
LSNYLVLWHYHVKPDRIAEFESIYNSNGEWGALFKQAEGYLGTELLHDTTDPRHYLTLDRWASAEAYKTFRKQWRTEYELLDKRCNGLTESEALIGAFTA